MSTRSIRRRRGFTLIELLVVVAIIAVLIAILLPGLGKAREKTKLVVCQTRMRGWGQGFLMYANDYNGRLPLDGGDGTSALPIGKWDDSYLWFNGVVSYTVGGNRSYNDLQVAAKASGTRLPRGGDNSLFVCPSAADALPGVGDQMTSDGFYATVGWYSVSPVFAETRPMLLCYGMNSQLRTFDFSDPNYARNTPSEGDVSKLTQLKPPALVPLLAEKRIRPDEIPVNDTPNRDKNLAQNKVTSNRFSARHNKGGNIVFADGHVDWLDNKLISHGLGANKNTYYNMPNVVIWNPTGTGQ